MSLVLNEYYFPVFTVEKVTDVSEFRKDINDALRHINIMNVEMLLVLNCIKMDRSLGPDHVIAIEVQQEPSKAQAEIFIFFVAVGKK